MASGDFNPFPLEGESHEQYAHRFEEAMLAEDWRLRFQANGASYRALGEALAEETDLQKIVSLTEQRGVSLVKVFGSGAMCLWKDDVLAEREGFETEFGGR